MIDQLNDSHRVVEQPVPNQHARGLRSLVFILIGCVVAIVLVVWLGQVTTGLFQVLAYALILPLILVTIVAVSASLRYRIARWTLSRRPDEPGHRRSR